MTRRCLALALLALAALPVTAAFNKPIALQDAFDQQDLVFTVEVAAVDAEKPTATFTVTGDLKGKCGFDKLAVNLTATTDLAKKDKHPAILLARLVKGRKGVVFANKAGDKYPAVVFVEGTWFSLAGTTDADAKAVRWAFLNCEPALRGTFKGTTAELEKIAADVLSGKAKAPEPDLKEKPGYGPPVEAPPEKKGEKQTAPDGGCTSGPPFAVIPSAFFVAPLAILAAIFPATFGGLAGGFERWRAFMSVVSINGILAAAFFFVQPILPDAWWASLTAYTLLTLAVVAAGLVWSGYRYRTAAADDAGVTGSPARRDILAVLGFAVASAVLVLVVAVVTNWIQTKNLFSLRLADLARLLFEVPARELTAGIFGMVAAAGYLAYRTLTARADGPDAPVRLSAPGESVALGTMLVFGTVLLASGSGAKSAAAVVPELAEGVTLVDAGVLFETTEITEPMSAITVSGDRLYLGGDAVKGFGKTAALLCVDRGTGKKAWSFTEGELRTVYCTPTVANGRVYVGEGLHTDPNCRLLCLDAATGNPVWAVRTTSHTEGQPVVADGKVYFSAGDDGLYCVRAADAAPVWHYKGKEQGLHIDTAVTLADGRIYGGSGYQTLALFCLDAATGNEVWRVPAPSRSFGQPLVVGGKVLVGLGTGNLSFDLSVEDEPGKPAETVALGMVAAFDAANGKEVWRTDLPKSSHTQLAADGRAVYAACRDGWVYALDHATGKRLWRFSYGPAMTAGPATAGGSANVRGSRAETVYVAGPDGRVFAHDPLTGKVFWERAIRDLPGGRDAEVIAAPTVEVDVPEPGQRTVYVPVTLTSPNNRAKAAAIVRFVDRIGE